MKATRSDENRLRDMLEAIEAIRRHPLGAKEEFDADEVLRFFFLKQVEIIGEAAFKLDAVYRGKSPEVPWRQIIGMRHILVHDYFDVNWEVLWQVLHDEIEPLHARLSAIVERLG